MKRYQVENEYLWKQVEYLKSNLSQSLDNFTRAKEEKEKVLKEM